MRRPVLLFVFSAFGLLANDAVLRRPGVKAAMEFLRASHEATVEKQIRIAEIPAPSMQEQERGAFLAAEFRRLGLKDIETDKVGKVLGWRAGKSQRTIVIAAHLDTVFPVGTNTKVRREGKRLYGPGLVDDSRGLASMLAIIEALQQSKVETERTLLFVADVGEEGLGNLRGIRYLTQEGPHKARLDAFLSIDGDGSNRIANQEMGSRRYKVTVKGPGGHSYLNFGRVNPAHALGLVIARLAKLEVPKTPKTVYNVGKIGGGTSINSVPFEAWFEFDMRSDDEQELIKLEDRFLTIVKQAVEEENAFRAASETKLTLDATRVAIRHAISKPDNSALVDAARWAAVAVGRSVPTLAVGSTDSNAAMHAGIPSITLDGGGRAGSLHSLDEWFEPENAWQGPQEVLLTVLAFDSAPATVTKRGLLPADYWNIQTPADLQLSPDGKSVVYSLGGFDQKTNRRKSSIWIAVMDGSAPARRFDLPADARSPQWSHDGRSLGFLSAQQVHTVPIAGGAPNKLTSLKDGVTAFQWSPDGAKLACVSKSAAPPRTSDSRHYTSPFYKFDTQGFDDHRRSHLWVVTLSNGEGVQITSNAGDNDTEPRWSPDGQRIAFLRQRVSISPLDGGIWMIPASGGNAERVGNITVGVRSVEWSPDGKKLLFIGAATEVAIPKLWSVTAERGAQPQLLSKELTYTTEARWIENGRAVLVTAASRGEHTLFRVNAGTGTTSAVTKEMNLRAFDAAHDGRYAVAANSATTPPEVYTAGKRLTSHNEDAIRGLELQTAERVAYTSVDGWKIEGFFMRPAGWVQGKKYPMVLSIHGGPNGMFGPQWLHEIQSLAGRGYAVFFTNPRGSSGYGEAFQRGVDKEWGGKAYQDIMKGVDAVLVRNSWIDTNRLGVTGLSYGGFMTNWIMTQTTRFRAAVSLSGITNFVSVEGTRDGYYGHARDFGGDLFQNFELYWRYSPVRLAKNVKSPVLILHGEQDYRVPLEQGEQWFRALKHFGVDAEMVIFPRESHVLRTEPKHAVEVMDWVGYWFDKHLNGNKAAIPPDVR